MRVADIAVEFFVRQRRAGLQRFFGIRHAGQRFVFDFDGIGGVLRMRSRVRDDGGDRYAGAVHRAARQHRMRRNLHVRQHLRWREIEFFAQVVAGDNRFTPGMALALLVSMEIIFACG